jgi:hypothetical protein|nr:MAG TPA: hypothetical protein [Herelleviridae sp.]
MELRKVIKFKVKTRLDYNWDYILYEPYVKLESE